MSFSENEIIEQLTANVPNREQIGNLQVELSKLPQVEPITEHYFSDEGRSQLHHRHLHRRRRLPRTSS